MSTHDSENIYTKLDNIKDMIPVKQIKPEDRKGKRTKEMEETFVSSHTYPSSNKQIRGMTQLQFEACNIRCKLDWIRNKRDKHLQNYSAILAALLSRSCIYMITNIS